MTTHAEVTWRVVQGVVMGGIVTLMGILILTHTGERVERQPRYQVGHCLELSEPLEAWERRLVWKIERVGTRAYLVRPIPASAVQPVVGISLPFTIATHYMRTTCPARKD